jgi:hypothetical protein
MGAIDKLHTNSINTWQTAIQLRLGMWWHVLWYIHTNILEKTVAPSSAKVFPTCQCLSMQHTITSKKPTIITFGAMSNNSHHHVSLAPLPRIYNQLPDTKEWKGLKLIWKNSVINHKHIKQINHKQPTQYIGATEPTISSPIHFTPLWVHLEGDLFRKNRHQIPKFTSW